VKATQLSVHAGMFVYAVTLVGAEDEHAQAFYIRRLMSVMQASHG